MRFVQVELVTIHVDFGAISRPLLILRGREEYTPQCAWHAHARDMPGSLLHPQQRAQADPSSAPGAARACGDWLRH